MSAAFDTCPRAQCDGTPQTCPKADKSLVSTSVVGVSREEKVFFRNDALFPVELLQVDDAGKEHSAGIMAPGERREQYCLSGDVWRARAIRAGSATNGMLLLEHSDPLFPQR